MSKQRKKSAKNTKMQGEGINESWFLPDDGSLQKQQDEHNRQFNQEKTLAAVSSWMEENLPDEEMDEEQVSGDPIPMPPDEELTEEYWGGIYGLRVAKAMVEMGLIKPRKDSTKSTD